MLKILLSVTATEKTIGIPKNLICISGDKYNIGNEAEKIVIVSKLNKILRHGKELSRDEFFGGYESIEAEVHLAQWCKDDDEDGANRDKDNDSGDGLNCFAISARAKALNLSEILNTFVRK